MEQWPVMVAHSSSDGGCRCGIIVYFRHGVLFYFLDNDFVNMGGGCSFYGGGY